ncbi:MAG: hypothetical protein GWO07_08255 [Candidatus Dadabacteria bacterium]|nr:hypothetical protein [Candidatus Dadabacteria bacterium]NIS08737.1 hypothetical protein [Candidatus Dadabacteria bacterium]NIV42621.1 hypothetical protein [Candidatus Dadabacteria bacterium]NIX15423.1 hypothetical protein [Candidatus Dadabacteria bacterium]NIY22086.1 hypothetical protein [Candidatus Dadabacteria bacterium]
MIFSQNKLSGRRSFLLAAPIVFLLIIFLTLKFYVPYKIKDYINDNPQWQGNNIKVGRIDYSLVSGFSFSNLKISKPKNKEDEYIKLNAANLDINFLSSILNLKAVIELIEIDKIEGTFSQQFINELSNQQTSDEIARDKDEQQIGIVLREIIVKSIDIDYERESKFKLADLILRLGDLQKLSDVSVRSNLEIFEKNFSIQSKINRRESAISAEVKLQTPALQILGSDNTSIPALNINSTINVDTKDEKSSRALVNIYEEKELIGKADFNINYIKKDNTVIINNSLFEIFNLIKLNLSGEISSLLDDPVFDISGNAEEVNIEILSSPFTDKHGIKLGGNLVKNDITITGSIKDSLVINNQMIFSSFAYKQGNNELVVNGLNLDVEGLLNSNKNNIVNIKASSKNFADGKIDLQCRLELKEQGHKIDGRLSASNIDLGKTSFVNKNIAGSILNLNTSFDGSAETLNLFTDLSAKDVSIKISDTQTLNISGLNSSKKILNTVSIASSSDNKNNVDIKLNDLEYKNLDYSGFKINKGKFNADVKDLLNYRKYNLRLSGEVLQNTLLNLILNSIEITAKADRDKSEDITGGIVSSSGSYKDYELADLRSDFTIGSSDLSFSDIKFAWKDKGSAHIREVNLPIQQNIPFPSVVNLKNGTFISNDKSYRLSTISLDLNKQAEDVWTGDINIQQADLYSVKFSKLRSLVSYNPKGYRLNTISGSLFGGKLTGFLSSQNNNLMFKISLKNPNIEGKENVLTAKKLNLSYQGKFINNEGSLPAGAGNLTVSNLFVEDYEEESKLNINLDIESQSETLSVKNGLISNSNSDVLLKFSSETEKPFSENRMLSYKTEKMNLAGIKNFLNPYLPPVIRFGEISGDLDIALTASNFPEDSTVLGYIDFKNINFKGDPFGTYLNIENLDGRLNLSRDETELKSINEVISRHTKNFKQAYKYTKSISRSDESNVNIKRLDYGFFTLENIRLLMNVVKNNLTIKELSTSAFGGKVTSSGVYNIGKSKKKAGKFYFLFNDISLKKITDSIPGTEGYISGRFNGLVSLVQKERRTSMLDGLFNFWTVKSSKEKKVVGKAFLERLGARERLLLGSSKNYDKGRLYGYINNGVITFNELEISNKTLGLKDLNIKVHNKRNSISVAHLLSVIRETARRAGTGSLDLQFQN